MPNPEPDRIWLTEEQLAELTRKTQPAAQARVLSKSVPPIPYVLVAGRPVVLVSDVLGRSDKPVKLNWE
jgi:hypothetical protein